MVRAPSSSVHVPVGLWQPTALRCLSVASVASANCVGNLNPSAADLSTVWGVRSNVEIMLLYVCALDTVSVPHCPRSGYSGGVVDVHCITALLGFPCTS